MKKIGVDIIKRSIEEPIRRSQKTQAWKFSSRSESKERKTNIGYDVDRMHM